MKFNKIYSSVMMSIFVFSALSIIPLLLHLDTKAVGIVYIIVGIGGFFYSLTQSKKNKRRKRKKKKDGQTKI